MSHCTTCSTNHPTIADYFSENLYTWCTNCGNFGIHSAVKRALVAEEIRPEHAVLCFDIGCNGNGSDKIGGYRFHGLHGRVLSFAAGASCANSQLPIIAFGGDGGTFGEGIAHFVHTIRGNFNVTFIFHNNLNYGLTQGQASPTTKMRMHMNTSPDGPTSDTLNAMRLALSMDVSFAARSFSGDVKHMTKTIQAGLRHKGFSFIEIFQACPSYNKETPHEWHQQRVYDVNEKVAGYDTSNKIWAHELAEDLEEKIAVGVLYQNKAAVPFMDRQENRRGFTSDLVSEVTSYESVAKKLFDRKR